MDLIADLHVHTVASGHAFSTIQEIAAQAHTKGLKIFGIADHGPCVKGAPSYHHFRSLKFVPRFIEDVMILRGAEANIINSKGSIDIPDHCLKNLDYVMAGFHDVAEYKKRDVKSNTNAMINAMDNPYVKIITHPGNPKFLIEYEKVVAAAKEKEVALEINNASLVIAREGSVQNCTLIARLIAKYDSLTVIGSDAHISFDVGNIDEAAKLVKAAGIKEEMVINSNEERLFEFLNIKL
jgi:putative hydrolase